MWKFAAVPIKMRGFGEEIGWKIARRSTTF
jgi:hypothetical protein